MTPDRRDPSTTGRDARVIPTEDDAGKDVVDRADRAIGTVTGVKGDTMYVDPHTSITDEIKAAIGWEDTHDDELPVPPDFVQRIDDEVVLNVRRDEEFQG